MHRYRNICSKISNFYIPIDEKICHHPRTLFVDKSLSADFGCFYCRIGGALGVIERKTNPQQTGNRQADLPPRNDDHLSIGNRHGFLGGQIILCSFLGGLAFLIAGYISGRFILDELSWRQCIFGSVAVFCLFGFGIILWGYSLGASRSIFFSGALCSGDSYDQAATVDVARDQTTRIAIPPIQVATVPFLKLSCIGAGRPP